MPESGFLKWWETQRQFSVPAIRIFVESEGMIYGRLEDGSYRSSHVGIPSDTYACNVCGPKAYVGKLETVNGEPTTLRTLQLPYDDVLGFSVAPDFLQWYKAQANTKGASLAPLKMSPSQGEYPDGQWVHLMTGLAYEQTESGFTARYNNSTQSEWLKVIGSKSLAVAIGLEANCVLRGNPAHGAGLVRAFTAWTQGGALRTQAKSNIDTAAGHLVRVFVSNPDPRPAPEGPCAFCASPANHWGTPWPLCAEAHCSAANHFHEERCQSGGVDTPETRTETLVYAKRWLEDQLAETAKQKPEGSCSFCNEPALFPNVPGTPLTCATHERAGWRLHHRLELGGVSDTPELRQEVLRHVAASDQFLRDGQREASGALTLFDEFGTERDRRGKGIAELKPPPEEIPLVGITPHYEWP